MPEFEPVLIKDYPEIRQAKTNQFNAVGTALQAVVIVFNGLTFTKDGEQEDFTPLVTEEIGALLDNPVSLVVGRMTAGQGVIVGGLRLEDDKALEMLQKPAGYNELLQAIEYFKAQFKDGGQHFRVCGLSAVPKYFVIDENDAVQFSDELTGMIGKLGKKYAVNEKQLLIYNFIKAVFDEFINTGAVNAGCAYLHFHSGGSGTETFTTLLKNLVERCDPRTGSFELNYARFGNIQ